MKRKSGLFVIFLTLFLAAVVFFRYDCLVFGTKFYLEKTFPKHLTFQKMTAEKGQILIDGLHYVDGHKEVTLDHVEFGLNFKEVFFHPSQFLKLLKRKTKNVLVPIKQYGMHLQIENGVLKIEEARYYFQFKDGEKKHEIGTLIASQDPRLLERPFLKIHFHMRGDQLISQISVTEAPTDALIQLAGFAFPEAVQGLKSEQGLAELRANVIFEKGGHIEELSTRFSFQNTEVTLREKQVALKVDHLKGELTYPEGWRGEEIPIWKKMESHLTVEGGSLLYGNKFALHGLEGNVSLDPRMDPALFLKGELASQDKNLALLLTGKGAVHEDHAYWLEFGLNLDDHLGTQCDTFISICSPQRESLVVQIEAVQLIPEQVEMLKRYLARSMPRLQQWEVQQGSFGGKLIALFEKKELAHFEIQELVAENVAVVKDSQPLFFSKFRGEGRLFETLNFEADLPTAHFFSLVAPALGQAYSQYRPDDFAHLTTSVRYNQKEVETSASVEFLHQKEAIQFGFKSQKHFPGHLEEIWDGWARSEKLSHLLYGPFITLLAPDLKVYGAVDLLATCDGKVADFALQVDHLITKHPLIDFKVASIGEKGKTIGRAKFSTNLQTGYFEGSIPLRDADAYDRQYGLVAHHLDADLIALPSSLKGKVNQAAISFDGKEILHQATFSFLLSEKNLIKELKAEMALPSDTRFLLEIPVLSANECEFSVFQENIPLLHFLGHRKEAWEGKVAFGPQKEELGVHFAWNPISNQALLDLNGKDLSLRCRKDASEYIVEHLKTRQLHLTGAFAPGEEGFLLPFFECALEKGVVRGAGHFFIDLPRKDQTFGMRSDLNIEAELKAPIALNLASKHPLKCAYSPEMGWIVSNLNLSGDGCTFQVEHLEHLSKTVGHKCHIALTESLINRWIEEHFLPPLLRDLPLSKGIDGKLEFEKDGQLFSCKGEILGTACQMQWRENQAELLLGENDPLKMVLHIEEDGVHFDTIRGKFKGLSANLKRGDKQELKGELALDFSPLSHWIDFPLGSAIKEFALGSGYQLEGIFTPSERVFDWSFKGKVKGGGFECLGYRLRSLEAKVEMEPGQITIENVDVTDDAGKMWIEEGALMRRGDHWVFSFPIVEVRGFQPSLLSKISGEKKAISPLTIKSATLQDLRGRLDDSMTLTGMGSLKFTNTDHAPPKNFPKQVLDQLGLDGAIFVPSSGEMDFQLQNGRCYLREIRQLMSEKKRSEFLPPKTGVMGYLDYQGNFFVDLNVRQHVHRSLSSPISLKVRGTWEEPEFVVK
jgi:hypothetical protein